MADSGSALMGRRTLSNLAGMSFGGERDLYEVMGYPRDLTVADYIDIYLRQDIAGRIVDAFPDATWRNPPDVLGSEGFINSWDGLQDRLNVWRTFHRLDRLTGLGHYGVLLLGLDGGEQMSMPAKRNDYNLLYVQPHSERTAQVTQWEDDPNSPRYGMPKLYRVTTGVNWTGTGGGQKTFTVHHSRVIHVAERALEDISIGTPRLERIYNRLMDLDKLLGGSAEIYWQNAAMMMAFKADPDVEWEPEEQSKMAEQLDEMQHGLRRMLRLRGVEPQNIAPGLMGSDPSNHIDKQLDFVSGAAGIPKRILTGSERGELASGQDENNWNSRIEERREQFATPSIIDQFVLRCISLGVLSPGYEGVEWQEADSLGENEKADIALKKAQAIAAYNSTMGAELVLPVDEFRKMLNVEDIEAIEMDDFPEDDESVIQFNKLKG